MVKILYLRIRNISGFEHIVEFAHTLEADRVLVDGGEKAPSKSMVHLGGTWKDSPNFHKTQRGHQIVLGLVGKQVSLTVAHIFVLFHVLGLLSLGSSNSILDTHARRCCFA